MNVVTRDKIVKLVSSQGSVEDMLIARSALLAIAAKEPLCITVIPETEYFDDGYEEEELCAAPF